MYQKKPKIRLYKSDGYKFVKEIVDNNQLNTVCEEARCPNIYECWDRRIATIMILGNICTRACGFCSVKTGKPLWDDPMEPYRTAMAVKKMNLNHVVITSVDRDDLKHDYGAGTWSETINQIHKHVPDCTVEVLTPDFRGYLPALKLVFNAKPEIFSHNIECVKRISKKVRSQASWERSLDVLKLSVNYGLQTKTGMMLGLGESYDEVITTMEQIRELGVSIFTLGQYLQPTKNHLPVQRYLTQKEFSDLKRFGKDLGFDVIESGILVRSSYRADQQAKVALKNNC
ncbi:MAG: lipoyl synthase [Candidatus Marinimicrobia bacterium]|nr:lipoyl synthase [Candidatus Neomarinimicrobiota bacterium]|tara:strand:- start:2278 stop:3135 length:858 start_codon:yes stop_codon:yes gene_type:complete